MKKVIIVSAVNLVEGGPLTILRECLRNLSVNLADEYRIIALVNRKELFIFPNIKYLEFPKSKKSWISRLFYEYYYFGKLAKRLNPFLWLSLHDITPNVTANRLAVYCHNPSPFYKLSFKEALMDPKFALFNTFYKYLYRINIKKNDFVIVQQDIMRKIFNKLFNLSNIVVAHPHVDGKINVKENYREAQGNRFIFFYPAFPRVFKNFEVICRAVDCLITKGVDNFEIYFTFSGTENLYARYIYKKYRKIKNIRFLGFLPRDKVFDVCAIAGCMIFPSRLETWGMPITEFKLFDKPIILADLEYAHETLGTYNKARFFESNNYVKLANLMEEFLKNKLIFEPIKEKTIPAPFASNWKELFEILLTQKNTYV